MICVSRVNILNLDTMMILVHDSTDDTYLIHAYYYDGVAACCYQKDGK